MKIVKLDRRHKAFALGYTFALRFDVWNSNAQYYANHAKRIFGPQSWGISNSTHWYEQFSKLVSPTTGNLTYWIFFRQESDLTYLMLAAG